MNKDERPYIRYCGFCKHGVLRFMRCRECKEVSAICDECELTWDDVPAVSEDAKTKSAGSFPSCPSCGDTEAKWTKLDATDVRRAKLSAYIAGRSV